MPLPPHHREIKQSDTDTIPPASLASKVVLSKTIRDINRIISSNERRIISVINTISSDESSTYPDDLIVSASNKIILSTEKITVFNQKTIPASQDTISTLKMAPVTNTSRLSAAALSFVPGSTQHVTRADLRAESIITTSSQLSALARPFIPGVPMHITRADSVDTSETANTDAAPTVTDVGAAKGAAAHDDAATKGTTAVTEDAAVAQDNAATATKHAAPANKDAPITHPTDITCMAMSFDSAAPFITIPKTMDQLFAHLPSKTITFLPHDYAKKTSTAKLLIKGPLALDELGSGNSWASRLSFREIQVFEAPLGSGPEVLTAVHYNPKSSQITSVSSLSVVQPPPGFKGHSARAIEETDTGRLIVYPIPRGKKRKAGTELVDDATHALEPKRFKLHRDRVAAMNAKLPRLDTTGAVQYNNNWFENPNRDPGSISSIWCETTMSDVDYFRSNSPVMPQSPAPAWLGADDSVQTHDSSLDTSFRSNDSTDGVSHSHYSTAATSQDTATTTQPRPTPFHRRGISDTELRKMIPYYQDFRSAVDLTEILQGKWPAYEVQSHRDAGTHYAYVYGRDYHMLTLEEIEKFEEAQSRLALKETQSAVRVRPVLPSPPSVIQPASGSTNDLSHEDILRLFGDTTVEDDTSFQENLTSDDGNTTTDEEAIPEDDTTHSPPTASYNIPYHRRGKSDKDLSKMMKPNHCQLAKLLTRILRGDCLPEEVAYHRRTGTTFPYVHENQVEFYDLIEIEELEELQAKRPQPPLRYRDTSGGPSPPLTPRAQAPSVVSQRTPVNQIHRLNLADYGYQPDWRVPTRPSTPPPTTSRLRSTASSATASCPFHLRGITTPEQLCLVSILPPHLIQEAFLLKTLLQQHFYGPDPSAWAFYASCPAVVDQLFPYVSGSGTLQFEMLTLREIGERERAQADLELETEWRAWRAGREARVALWRREWNAKEGRRVEGMRRRLALAERR